MASGRWKVEAFCTLRKQKGMVVTLGANGGTGTLSAVRHTTLASGTVVVGRVAVAVGLCVGCVGGRIVLQ